MTEGYARTSFNRSRGRLDGDIRLHRATEKRPEEAERKQEKQGLNRRTGDDAGCV